VPLGLSLIAWSAPQAPAAVVNVASPDGTVVAELSDTNGAVRYRVTVDGREVLAPSRVGFRCDGVELGTVGVLGAPRFHQVDETYPFVGGRSQAVNRAREATVALTSADQACEIDVHVADDGVGVRLRVPAKSQRHVESDNSSWHLPGDPVVWVTGKNVYEDTYVTTALSKLGSQGYGLPLTAKVGDVYVALTQAALKDYGDILVRPGTDGALEGVFYADKQGWLTDNAVVQPWRVTMVARTLDALVNSTLVANLNPAPRADLAKADWIRPGRSTWQWLSIGAPRFDDQHAWVDWTHELGYEYYLVDEGWEKWPDAWASLASVCAYAQTRGVKVWLWVHSKGLKTPEARKAYFQKAVEAGVVGVKIDFPGLTNHWWSNWYYDTAADAAEFKLLVDYHGAMVTTGLERTWPNVLTREAVRGHEWHITRYKRLLEPQHDVILPFTRYLSGPGDYTPTVFNPKELQGNTWSHELAQAFVFTSPFLCMGGHPQEYLANPAKDLLMAVPAVWDETRVLPGSEPGKIAAFARRSGKNWFVAVLNGADETTVDLPLDFLAPGAWQQTRVGDVPGKPDAYDRAETKSSRTDHLKATLSPRGGLVAWFRPASM
jgi:alpha-glucosidase